MSAAAMQIALIDPSLFTLPYDCALAGGLEAAGHRVVLHGRKPGKDDNAAIGVDLAAQFYPVASHPIITRLPGPLRLGIKGIDHVASMLRLLRRLRAERPGVIHFQWLPLPQVDRRLLSRFASVAPTLLTVHDTDPFNGAPSAALQSSGFAQSLACFDGLIVHTEQGRGRLIASGVPENRVHVLPHGVLGAAHVTPPLPDPMDGELTFLLFGKIKPYKGLDILVDAFASLPAELQAQARLRVVGKPYMDMAPIHALAAARGIGDRLRIEPRFVLDDEVAELFGSGVVAVFPYREIEASGVLSIALGQARPVIASRLGNFAETVEDGVQGVLVPPADTAALTAALARMIADRGFAASCSTQAGELAAAIPSWEAIAHRTVAVYDAARQHFLRRQASHTA